MKNNIIKNIIAEAMKADGDRMTEYPDQPFALRCGDWQADENGARLEYLSGSGNLMSRVASTVPIMPSAVLRNAETGLSSVELMTFVRGEWRTVVCPMSKISSAVKIVQLADNGIEVNSETAANLVKFLAELLRRNPDIIPERKAVSHLGWFEGEFLPFTAPRGEAETSALTAANEPENNAAPYVVGGEYAHMLKPVHECGSPERWVEGMRPLRKSLPLRLMQGASFASPLLEPLNLQPFVLHLWGPTGCGKTLTLQAAMSIWGDPSLGAMTKTMNMTVNAMLSASAFLRNLPFGGDELQTIKRRRENYDRLIMSCTEGIDRGRMTYSSLNATRVWRCAYLFTGEEPCVSPSSGGGVLNRVICLKAGENDVIISDPSAAVALFSENYGSAGRVFIEEYRKEPQTAKEIYRKYLEDLVKTDATGKQAAAMAAVLTGDHLARKYLFPDEDELKPEDVAKLMKSEISVSVSSRAREFTEGLIAANVNMFSVNNVSREVWGKIEEGCAYFNKTVLCRELAEEGYSFEAVKSDWARDGFLIKNTNGRYTHLTTTYGVRSKYVKLNISCKSDE